MIRTIQYEDKTMNFTQWADALDMPRKRIRSRWDRGVRDPALLLNKERFRAESKWDYSQGNHPICSIHKIEAVWYKNKSKIGQWECLGCQSEKAKKFRLKKRNTFSYQLRITLAAARNRRKCELNIKELQDMWEYQKGLCAITGFPMQKTPGGGSHNRFKFSLDRIDNKKPYLKENVWLVCEFANRAKGDLSVDELMAFSKGILSIFNPSVVS